MKKLAFLLFLYPIFSFAGIRQDHKDSLFTMGSLESVARNTKSSQDNGFAFWFHNAKKVDAVMGNDYAEWRVLRIIMKEDSNVIAANEKAVTGLKQVATLGDEALYAAPEKNAPEITAPDWKQIYEGIKSRYGAYYADRATNFVKMNFYAKRWDRVNYDIALTKDINKYTSTRSHSKLNECAWEIFSYSTNKEQLKSALKWIRLTIDANDKDPKRWKYIDTYANLLYKTGQNKKAIKWEEKVMELASNKDKEAARQTLDKMKNGVKTW